MLKVHIKDGSELPDKMRWLREQRGLTAQQVEDGTGVSLSALWHWEHGKRRPRIDLLTKLLNFYRAQMTFGYEEEAQ